MRTIAGIRQDQQPSTLRPIILRSLHVNYLSHAYKHLHDPYFVAGTALPDWMSVVNRRNRARSQSAEKVLSDADPRIVSMALGVMRHHHDDRWFHQTPEFALSVRDLPLRYAVCWRRQWASGRFCGHIVVELLLDAYSATRIPIILCVTKRRFADDRLELSKQPLSHLQQAVRRTNHARTAICARTVLGRLLH